MRKIVIATLAIATLIVSCAITTRANAAITYREAVKACGIEWKASDARKQVPKGEGQKAWNAFRAECVKRQGYVPVRRGVTTTADMDETNVLDKKARKPRRDVA